MSIRDKVSEGYDSGLTWTGHLNLSKPKVSNYRIVSGMPDNVDRHVQEMLNDGWELNGSLMIMKVDTKDIVIQGMVKYDKTS